MHFRLSCAVSAYLVNRMSSSNEPWLLAILAALNFILTRTSVMPCMRISGAMLTSWPKFSGIVPERFI